MSQIHQSLKHFRDVNSAGWGQTLNNYSASRTGGVSYRNTTGRPIIVSIYGQGTFRWAEVSTDNSNWKKAGAVSGEYARSASFLVPDGHYYRLSGGGASIDVWAEVR